MSPVYTFAFLAAGDGLLSAAADFRPAGNIMPILLILSEKTYSIGLT